MIECNKEEVSGMMTNENAMVRNSETVFNGFYSEVDAFCEKNNFPLYSIKYEKGGDVADAIPVNKNFARLCAVSYVGDPDVKFIRLDDTFKRSLKTGRLVGKTKRVFTELLSRSSRYFVGDFSENFCSQIGVVLEGPFAQYVDMLRTDDAVSSSGERKERRKSGESSVMDYEFFKTDASMSAPKKSLRKLLKEAEDLKLEPIYQIASRNNLVRPDLTEDRSKCADYIVNLCKNVMRLVTGDKDKFYHGYLPIFVAPSVWKAYNEKMPKLRHAHEVLNDFVNENIDELRSMAMTKRYESVKNFELSQITRAKAFLTKYEDTLGDTDFYKHFEESIKSLEGLNVGEVIGLKDIEKVSGIQIFSGNTQNSADLTVSDKDFIEKFDKKYKVVTYREIVDEIRYDYSNTLKKNLGFLKFFNDAIAAGVEFKEM